MSLAIPGLQPALTYNASAPPSFNHVIILRIPDVSNNALRHPDGPGSINMTQVLTHEVAHTWWPTCYYIARVLVEYLTDVKALHFDDLMSRSVTDTETLNELISAYRAGNIG